MKRVLGLWLITTPSCTSAAAWCACVSTITNSEKGLLSGREDRRWNNMSHCDDWLLAGVAFERWWFHSSYRYLRTLILCFRWPSSTRVIFKYARSSKNHKHVIWASERYILLLIDNCRWRKGEETKQNLLWGQITKFKRKRTKKLSITFFRIILSS